MEATSATVSLETCCFTVGRSSGWSDHATAAAATQAMIASTSRVTPRTAASSAETSTMPSTARSRTENGIAGYANWGRDRAASPGRRRLPSGRASAVVVNDIPRRTSAVTFGLAGGKREGGGR